MALKQILQRSSQVSFYGHETFPFRHSWLMKGVNAVAQSASFFSSERAMIELGVGKNMVQAIRYWCLALRLIREDATTGMRSGRYVPTEFGRSVFAEGGFCSGREHMGPIWMISFEHIRSRFSASLTDFSYFSFH